MSDVLSSKKFWAAVIAAVTAFVASYLGLSEIQVATIVAPISAYILGQGMADAGKEAEKAKASTSQADVIEETADLPGLPK